MKVSFMSCMKNVETKKKKKKSKQFICSVGFLVCDLLWSTISNGIHTDAVRREYEHIKISGTVVDIAGSNAKGLRRG